MRKSLSAIVASALLLGSSASFAQLSLSYNSTIKVSGVQFYCSTNGNPVVTARLLVNQEDRGLPGVVYVAAHNDEQTEAWFSQGGTWVEWQSGYFPMYSINGGGIQDTTITLELPAANSRSTLPGVAPFANIFIGYGVLTNANEAMVQRVAAANAAARAKTPDRNLPVMDPDHQRRAYVQEDLTKKVKYQMIAARTSLPSCQSQTFSGG